MVDERPCGWNHTSTPNDHKDESAQHDREAGSSAPSRPPHALLLLASPSPAALDHAASSAGLEEIVSSPRFRYGRKPERDAAPAARPSGCCLRQGPEPLEYVIG